MPTNRRPIAPQLLAQITPEIVALWRAYNKRLRAWDEDNDREREIGGQLSIKLVGLPPWAPCPTWVDGPDPPPHEQDPDLWRQVWALRQALDRAAREQRKTERERRKAERVGAPGIPG